MHECWRKHDNKSWELVFKRALHAIYITWNMIQQISYITRWNCDRN